MNGGVVTLRTAGSENHFPGVRPNQIRYLLPCRFDHCLKLRAKFITTGWIPPVGGEIRHHRLYHLWEHLGCAVVIQINHRDMSTIARERARIRASSTTMIAPECRVPYFGGKQPCGPRCSGQPGSTYSK